MNVFLINLDKDVERLKSADAQLARLGVEYKRVSAVYAKELPSEEKRKSVNAFRWWCAVGRPVRDGEIGCALSHYGIYKAMTSSPVCILEDDVILDSRFKEVLTYVEHQIDTTRSQVVLLSNHTKSGVNADGVSLRCATADMYTEGYVITPKAAQALIRANLPLQCPCDWWGRWVKRGIIELYHAFPTVCRQDQTQYESGTVEKGCFRVDDLPVIKFLVHKASRLVGKTIDKVLG